MSRHTVGSDRVLQMSTSAALGWEGGHGYLLVAVRRLLDRGVAVHLDVRAGERSSDDDLDAVLFDIHDMELGDVVTVVDGPAAVGPDRVDGAEVLVVAAVAGRHDRDIDAALGAGRWVVATDVAAPDGPRPGLIVVPRRDVEALVRALSSIAAEHGPPAGRPERGHQP